MNGLAENIAMLDHFTNGRVFAGFSRGNTPRWTATFGQHIDVTATESDKSAADQRNRAVFYENWKIVKALWTQDTVHIDGDFWKVPKPVTWDFNPTNQWASGTVGPDKTLKEIGIVPRPYQQPHPPVYYPFSQSMETVRFWGREGGKMVAFIADTPGGIMDPATGLPVQIFLWADSPERAFVERTSAAILVLLVFMVLMNSVAIVLRRRFERRW